MLRLIVRSLPCVSQKENSAGPQEPSTCASAIPYWREIKIFTSKAIIFFGVRKRDVLNNLKALNEADDQRLDPAALLPGKSSGMYRTTG